MQEDSQENMIMYVSKLTEQVSGRGARVRSCSTLSPFNPFYPQPTPPPPCSYMQYSHVVPSHPCGFKACVCVGEMVPFLPGRHLHWHHWSITSPSWVSRKNCHLLPFGWWYKQCPTWHCPIKQDNSLTALNRSDYNSVNWIHKKALQINPQTLHIYMRYLQVGEVTFHRSHSLHVTFIPKDSHPSLSVSQTHSFKSVGEPDL